MKCGAKKEKGKKQGQLKRFFPFLKTFLNKMCSHLYFKGCLLRIAAFVSFFATP